VRSDGKEPAQSPKQTTPKTTAQRKPAPTEQPKPGRWEVPVLPDYRLNLMTLHPGKQRVARGRFYVLNLFVSSGNRIWTPTKVKDTKHKLEVAEKWIQKEVAGYGVTDLDFANEYLYEGPDGKAPWREQLPEMGYSYQAKYELAESMARHLTGYSIVELARKGMRRYHASQFALVLYLECDGRSHCCSPSNYLPIVLNFARAEDGESELNSGTIAHELLHSIGGAIDLYSRAGYPRVKSDRAEQYYPDSIMLHSSNIRSRTLDEVNAWCIGVGPYRRGFEWYVNR